MDYQSRNLTIARGSVLFAKFLPGTMTPGPYRDFGNCPEFTLSRTTEMLSHRSSRRGMNIKDAEISLSADLSGTVVMDDVKPKNMAMWFMNDLQTVTVASATAQNQSIADVQLGGIYQIGRSEVAPLGLRNISAVTVAAGATSYQAGLDFEVDGPNGLLTILEGGAIVEGADLTVTYTVAASTYQQVSAGEKAVEGELKFISENPYGPNRIILLPRAKITPQGDLSLIGDPDSPDWMQLPFSIAAMQRGNMPIAINADGLPALGNAA
ncbi:phage tail tube protein [Paracoccus yeei]|uniref:phage tail tube protein n=1 Tax=Paracoccus yeei TaxID=147645 RepID=UPI00174DE600|nr:hypothetical protein [Paracoccus yeei]